MEDALAVVAALPGVAEAAAEARDAVDRLRAHRVLRRHSPAVTAESVLRGSVASAALSGADVDPAEVRRLVGAVHDPPRAAAGAGHVGLLPAAGPLVTGAVRAAAGLGDLLPVWERAPLQALARLHVLAAADALPAEQLGRPRPDPLLDSAEIGPRLAALAGLAAARTSAPAVVLAAVVHGELLALRPFAWGNGIVARAAQRLVLIGRGLDPSAVSVPEVGHLDLGVDVYRKALADYATGTAEGVTTWVVHCAEAVRLGAREGLAVCESVGRAGR